MDLFQRLPPPQKEAHTRPSEKPDRFTRRNSIAPLFPSLGTSVSDCFKACRTGEAVFNPSCPVVLYFYTPTHLIYKNWKNGPVLTSWSGSRTSSELSEFNHLLMAFLGCPMQESLSIIVHGFDVGSGLEGRFNHLLVACAGCLRQKLHRQAVS